MYESPANTICVRLATTDSIIGLCVGMVAARWGWKPYTLGGAPCGDCSEEVEPSSCIEYGEPTLALGGLGVRAYGLPGTGGEADMDTGEPGGAKAEKERWGMFVGMPREGAGACSGVCVVVGEPTTKCPEPCVWRSCGVELPLVYARCGWYREPELAGGMSAKRQRRL